MYIQRKQAKMLLKIRKKCRQMQSISGNLNCWENRVYWWLGVGGGCKNDMKAHHTNTSYYIQLPVTTYNIQLPPTSYNLINITSISQLVPSYVLALE